MRFEYPARFKREGNVTLVSFRDVPEALTFADAGEDPFTAAAGALQAALEVRVERNEEIPPASNARRGERFVAVPIETALKAAIHGLMRQISASKSALARALVINEKAVRRMLDPKHGTKTENLVKALSALGAGAVVEIRRTDPRIGQAGSPRVARPRRGAKVLENGVLA